MFSSRMRDGTNINIYHHHLNSSYDDDEVERHNYGDRVRTLNVLENCEVTMATHSNTSSNTELLKAKAVALTQHWSKEYDDIMVETRAYQHAKEMLEESHSVLISGGPGDGKTTLAVHLTLSLVSDGYLPVVAYSPADIQRCCNPYEKMVFFLDDVFGKAYLVKEYLENWVQRGNTILLLMSENIRLIFTSRNEILYECFTKMYLIPAFANLTDLQMPPSSLNSCEKKAIFNKLIGKYQGTNDYPEHLVDTFCTESHIIAFPATCRLLAIHGNMSNAHEIMNAPFTFLFKEVRRISMMDETKLQYAILVLVMLCGGRLSDSLLSSTQISEDDNCNVQTILVSLGMNDVPYHALAKAVKASKSYIICRDGYWVFLDHAISDAVSVVYSETHLNIFLHYADREDLYKLLDVKDGISNGTFITPTVVITQDHYCEMFEKMTMDVLHGHHNVIFKSRCLQDPHYQREWLRYLDENQSFHKFAQALDEYDRTPMYYMAMYDTKVLIEYSLANLKRLKDRGIFSTTLTENLHSNKHAHTRYLDGFYGAIEGGNSEARDSIMQMWGAEHGAYKKQILGYFNEQLCLHSSIFGDEIHDEQRKFSLNPGGLAQPMSLSSNDNSEQPFNSIYLNRGGFAATNISSITRNAILNIPKCIIM